MNWYKKITSERRQFLFDKEHLSYDMEQPFREDDVLKVYHGFNSFDEAYVALTRGLSGKEAVPRSYSFESNNNPYGLFISLNLDNAKYFTGAYGPAAVAIGFNARYGDLEAPIWPEGSFTGYGGYSKYWNWDKLEEQREQARLESREKARGSAAPAIADSDRPELAQTLLGSEYQALFIGHLDPNQITEVWVRTPREDGYQHLNDPWERLSRSDFIKRFKEHGIDEKSKAYKRVRERFTFLPNDEWDHSKFISDMGARFNIDEDGIVKAFSFRGEVDPNMVLQYMWPKQVPGFMKWLDIKQQETTASSKVGLQKKSIAIRRDGLYGLGNAGWSDYPSDDVKKAAIERISSTYEVDQGRLKFVDYGYWDVDEFSRKLRKGCKTKPGSIPLPMKNDLKLWNIVGSCLANQTGEHSHVERVRKYANGDLSPIVIFEDICIAAGTETIDMANALNVPVRIFLIKRI